MTTILIACGAALAATVLVVAVFLLVRIRVLLSRDLRRVQLEGWSSAH